MNAEDGAVDEESRWAGLREVLLGDEAGEPERVRCLQELVTLGDPARAADVLREARDRPVNVAYLDKIVRAYGFLGDPELVYDIAGDLDHPAPSVVKNALKSLIALDPEAAVRLSGPVIMKSDPERGWALSEILAERCPREAERLFMSFAFAHQAKLRAATLVFLRDLSADESIPIALEMLRRERDRHVLELLSRLLELKVSRDQSEVLERFIRELQGKVDEVRATLSRLVETPDCSEFTLASAQGTSIGSTDSEMQEAVARMMVSPPLVQPPPARRERSAQAAMPAPPSGVGLALGLGLSIVLIVVGIFVTTTSIESPPEGKSAMDSPFGFVGNSVEITGELVEIEKTERTLRVRTEDGWDVRIYFEALDPGGLTVGDELSVSGVLREIRSGSVAIVMGFAVKP